MVSCSCVRKDTGIGKHVTPSTSFSSYNQKLNEKEKYKNEYQCSLALCMNGKKSSKKNIKNNEYDPVGEDEGMRKKKSL